VIKWGESFAPLYVSKKIQLLPFSLDPLGDEISQQPNGRLRKRKP
jgi:hypothetical protein